MRRYTEQSKEENRDRDRVREEKKLSLWLLKATSHTVRITFCSQFIENMNLALTVRLVQTRKLYNNPQHCIYLFNVRILIGFHFCWCCSVADLSFRMYFIAMVVFFHRIGLFQSSNSEIEKIVDFFFGWNEKKNVQKMNSWSIFSYMLLHSLSSRAS